jgi:hypothetical protein
MTDFTDLPRGEIAMDLLKGVTVFIAWLSGSLAALGALLYSCGYLVTFAHLHLLGIDHLLVSSNERFIQQGARFLAVTGELLTGKLLGLLAIFPLLGIVFGIVFCIVFIPVYMVLSRIRPKTLPRIRSAWRKVKAKLAELHRPLLWSTDVSVYLILLVLLFIFLSRDLPDFTPPLTLSDLLYKDVDPHGSEHSLEGRLLCWLLTDDRRRLQNHFADLLDAELLAVVLVALASYVTRRQRQRLLMVMPFLIVLVLCTIYFPILYGVLVHRMNYNVVTLVGVERIEKLIQSSFFLLQKTNDDFLVWDSARKTVLWIQKNDVKVAEIGRGKALFARKGPCSE